MLADRLKADLGIDVTLKVQDLESLTADADAGRIEGLYLLGARPRYPDASYLLDGHFGSQASAQFGPQFEDVVTALDDASSARRTRQADQGRTARRTTSSASTPRWSRSPMSARRSAIRADVDGAVLLAARHRLVRHGRARAIASQYAFMQADRAGQPVLRG